MSWYVLGEGADESTSVCSCLEVAAQQWTASLLSWTVCCGAASMAHLTSNMSMSLLLLCLSLFPVVLLLLVVCFHDLLVALSL